MIFDIPPLSQTVTNLGPPKSMSHFEQKVNKQIPRRMETPLNNYNRYYILNIYKKPYTYWVFLINPEIPLQV